MFLIQHCTNCDKLYIIQNSVLRGSQFSLESSSSPSTAFRFSLVFLYAMRSRTQIVPAIRGQLLGRFYGLRASGFPETVLRLKN